MPSSCAVLPFELQEQIIKLAVEEDLTPKRLSRRPFSHNVKTVLPLPHDFGSVTWQLGRVNSAFYAVVLRQIDEKIALLNGLFGMKWKLCVIKEYWDPLRCKHGKHMAKDERDEMSQATELCVSCGKLRAQIFELHALRTDLYWWHSFIEDVLNARPRTT